MSIENKFLKVTMPDGSKWKIPVRVIAEHRSRHYATCKTPFEEVLKENTLPLFEEEEYEIEDWASNNMDWSDVEKYAVQIKNVQISFEELQDGWINGEKEIIEE